MAGFPGAHVGRVAVVTGGGTGLGRAFSLRLARDGARVVVAYLRDQGDTVDAITREGGEAIAVQCDVTSAESVERLRAAADDLGGCDILVNNAGVHPNTPWNELEFDEWRQVLSVNLDAAFLTCKAFSKGMAERGFGRIINISSDVVDLVLPGFAHYTASKAGLIGLTRSLATELAQDGITANCVLPGLTRTPSVDAQWAGRTHVLEALVQHQAIKRPGVPEDLDGVVSFLATEDARWLTGQSIVLDGGQIRY
ncbi:SDR family oxidoreductase [Sphaerisporangium sp. NPDC051011]|uniref:SDR family NAD(P)-dependent oxidoreductase n=1 Tax=Sphaerisporangium sp. NPDC051011 TaxID=3155792 RepID=UPI0033DB8A81